MRILGFGTYDVAKHPRVGTLLEGLRASGDEVLEANAPLRLTTADRVNMLRRPWTSVRLARDVLIAWQVVIRQAWPVRSGRRLDAVIVGYLGHFDVLLARVLFPHTTIVLDHLVFASDTARDRGVRSQTVLRLLALIDRLAVAAADVVLIDTEENLGLLSVRQRPKAVVVPVGAGRAWFSARIHQGRSRSSAPLRAVFFGLYTPLQGAAVIGEALGLLADRTDIEVTMIGSGQDYALARESATGNDHVDWVDWIGSEELPGVVATHDVCLGIFGTTPKARRVIPNKVYQGSAAGCGIITSDTTPQRRALGDGALFVPPGDARALAEALASLASEPTTLQRLRAAASDRSSACFDGATVVVPLRRRLSANFSDPSLRGPSALTDHDRAHDLEITAGDLAQADQSNNVDNEGQDVDHRE